MSYEKTTGAALIDEAYCLVETKKWIYFWIYTLLIEYTNCILIRFTHIQN